VTLFNKEGWGILDFGFWILDFGLLDYTLHRHNLSSSRLLCPHPARTSGSGSPLSCRFFILGEPQNKNDAPKLGRGVGGEGKIYEGEIYALAKYTTIPCHPLSHSSIQQRQLLCGVAIDRTSSDTGREIQAK
jgi:hypothetical protein